MITRARMPGIGSTIRGGAAGPVGARASTRRSRRRPGWARASHSGGGRSPASSWSRSGVVDVDLVRGGPAGRGASCSRWRASPASSSAIAAGSCWRWAGASPRRRVAGGAGRKGGSTGIAVDGAGKLYVADTFSFTRRARRWLVPAGQRGRRLVELVAARRRVGRRRAARRGPPARRSSRAAVVVGGVELGAARRRAGRQRAARREPRLRCIAHR